MKKQIGLILAELLLWAGIVNFIILIILCWFVHGDVERYIWIINRPFPFSHFGGGPFQLFMYGSLFVLGTALIIISLILKKVLNN